MKLRDIMNRYPMTLQKGADFALARQMMAWAGIRHIPIMDGESLVGVVSERDILEVLARKDVDVGANPEISIAMRPAQTASPEDSITEAAARMAADKIGCLPITQRGALVGMITTVDILNAEVRGAMEPQDSDVKAGDLCDRAPVTTEADDRLLDAAGRMQSHGVRHLPVVDGTGKVLGILSDTDIRAAIGDPMSAYESGARDRFDALRVRDYMTRDPFTANARDSLASIARMFVDHRLTAVPVVDDDDKLAGMISYLDILRTTAR
jgi:CBS domain-containing protein